jgi:ribosomal protein S18 acetylase RimI-like enzyme
MMNNKFTLQKGQPENAPEIARLIMMAMSEECCRHFYGENHTADDFHALITSLCERTDTQYSYANTICAIVDSKIVGISVSYDGGRLHELRSPFVKEVLKRFGRDFSGMPDETQTGELYLDSLAVLPHYRGRGIATALLKATAKRADEMGVGPVGLLVDKGNPKAEHLYTSVGFHYVDDNLWGGHEMKHLQLSTSKQ